MDDEIILAYDLYLKRGRKRLYARDPEVIALSEFLRALPWHTDEWQDPQFRNPRGTAMKIQQLLDYEAGRVPPSIHKGAQRLADTYRDYPERVHAWADALRAGVDAHFSTLTDTDEPFTEPVEAKLFREGRASFAHHRRLERNRQAVILKLAQVKRNSGRLACEVCDFDFEEAFGELGAGFVECHHTIPLSEVGERDTKLTDLAVVCPNCHRMLHKRNREGKLLSISELRTLREERRPTKNHR